MRPACRPLILALTAACGSDPTTTMSATDSASSSSTTQPPPTTEDPTSSSSGAPTGGSGGQTDSGTTTTTSSTSTTGEDPSTTSSVQTDTGPDHTSTGPDHTTSTTSTTTTGTTSTTDTGDESTTEAVENCPCPDLEVALDDGVFVLSDTGELWKYFPMDNMFTLLGPLACDLPPPTFSMAVDRLGFAWVEYPNGQLRKIDVTDVAQCTNPGYVPAQQGVMNFGMAFVSNSAADKCDRIFGNEYNGFPDSDFFSIDPMTLQLMKLGTTPYGIAELTGTGDGRAFLFTVTNPPQLVEVDKTNGVTLTATNLNGVQIGSGLAFAFFAGDFYFFTDAQNDFTSEVTHMDYDDSDNDGQQNLTQVFNNAPLRILGAGVSTCVPTLPQ
jgi:hypothetical protein